MVIDLSPLPWPEIEVELHENERAWIGGGFSKNGLLPTDRRSYSTTDGSLSWKSLQEAEEAILGQGWDYADEKFVPRDVQEEVDEEGWRYARDFSKAAVESNKNKRNAVLHWVRYRCIVRKKIFRPEQFLPKKVYSLGEHVDSVTKEALSVLLLEVLAFITLIHNGSSLTFSVALPLKEDFIKSLFVGSNNRTEDDEDDAPLNVTNFKARLQSIADSERSKHPFSMLSQVPFSQRHKRAASSLSRRCEELSSTLFPKAERDAIAGLIIRDLDPKFQLHCDQEICGDSCDFASIACYNNGCNVRMSRKHLGTHDETCAFKRISCPLGCGNEFPRQETQMHVSSVCSLRETKCPFAKVGCTASVLAKDVSQHVLDDTNSHLLLAVNRMMEYQNVMKGFRERINKLEIENKKLDEENRQLKAQFLADRDNAGKVMKSLESNGTRVSRKVESIESYNKKEFRKIWEQLRQLQKDSRGFSK